MPQSNSTNGIQTHGSPARRQTLVTPTEVGARNDATLLTERDGGRRRGTQRERTREIEAHRDVQSEPIPSLPR
jgi:hypothetical protein